MYKIAEPSYFGFEFDIFALIVVDFNLISFLIDKIDAFFILAIDRKGGQITKMKLDNVITHPCDNFKVINCNRLFQIYQRVDLSCPFSHLLQLEEGVFCDEERFEVEQSHEIFIVFIALGNLLLDRFATLLYYVVILLSKLKDKICLLGFVVTTNYSRRQ